MKKFLWCLGVVSLFSACQDELYENDLKSHKADQGAYFNGSRSVQLFVRENKDVEIDNLSAKLVKPETTDKSVRIIAGSQEQLSAYNKQNNTNFILLPASMYETATSVNIRATEVEAKIPLTIKNVVFPKKGQYALPIKVEGIGVNTVSGQNETIVILEEQVATKSLRIKDASSSKAGIFPKDYKVAQWTLEVMVNRSAYDRDNRSIVGTDNTGDPKDEIFTRFGDVTIKPNQLQIKTGASQIDISASKFSALENVWYPLVFSYDGKTTRVFVNGEEVVASEIREGAYSITGFWVGGSNDLIREVRLWNRAVPQSELKENMWKTIDPKSKGLILYYPMNGKKYDHATGNITEDESRIWDWSATGGHLPLPSGAKFDDNKGEYFIFPPEKK